MWPITPARCWPISKRSAVLGVSDGLVTNVCLILAMAGADASASAVRLAGFDRRALVQRDPELILDEPRFLRFASTSIFGVDPEELGSPMTAALSSLVLLAFGAFVPLAPWLLTSARCWAWP